MVVDLYNRVNDEVVPFSNEFDKMAALMLVQ
jgi:hypothetical protein